MLTERIYGFITTLAQNLKHQIALLGILTIILATESPQKNIADFVEEADDDDDESKLLALIYVRVSSHEQTNNGDEEENTDDDDTEYDQGSIEGQIEELQKIADRKDLELAHEPIRDEAQSGTNFDRAGIKKVFKLAQKPEVGYLLVEKIDRLGRTAPETLYFIHLLQSKYDVSLITASGETDIGSVDGLTQATLRSLMAEVQNNLRTAKAQKERVRNFVEYKEWKSYSPIIPLGYDETDDKWLEPDPEEADVVQDLFEIFNECQTYAETKRKIDDKYDDVLEGHKVKTLLTNPVYIGRPQIPEEWVVDLPYDNVVEDDTLQLINEKVFQRSQEIIDKKDRKHSSDDDTQDFDDFVDDFGLFSVLLSSYPVALIHDCGQPMVKDGQERIGDDIKTHRYYCRDCDEARKWPTEWEYKKMKIAHLLLDESISLHEALREILLSEGFEDLLSSNKE